MIDLYADRPDLYDLLHDDQRDDLEFYVGFAHELVPEKGEILELGCGTGRVALALLQAGFRVSGVDNQVAMLDRARSRAATFGAKATFVEGDMTKPQEACAGRMFDLVIVAANTFMHLQDHASQIACLEGIKAVLKPGAVAVIDLASPFHIMSLPQHTATLRQLKEDSEDGSHTMVTGILDVDPTLPVAVDRLLFDEVDRAGVLKRLTTTVELRLVFMPELELLLARAGLGIADAYGGYDLNTYDSLSERMIAVIRTYDN